MTKIFIDPIMGIYDGSISDELTIYGHSADKAYAFECIWFTFHSGPWKFIATLSKDSKKIWTKETPRYFKEAANLPVAWNNFLIECCMELLTEGIFITGSYEFEGVWTVNPPADECIDLPDGLVD